MKKITYIATNLNVNEGDLPQHFFSVTESVTPVVKKTVSIPKPVKRQIIKDGVVAEIDAIEIVSEEYDAPGDPEDILIANHAIGAATKEEALALLEAKYQ